MTEATVEETTYCEKHPDRETGLRCNRCGRYMCAECAVQTPVGYRCRECVRTVEDKFFTGTNTDYLIAGGIALAATFGAAFLLLQLRLTILLLMIFIAIPAGGALAQLIFRAVGRRRGRYTAQIAAAGVMLGAAAAALLSRGFSNIGLWVFAGIVAALVYGRFKVK